MRLDLYGLYHARKEDTDFSVQVNDKKIGVHGQILMAALGIRAKEKLNELKTFLEKQKDRKAVEAFIRDLYLGTVMKNPGSKKLFKSLRKNKNLNIKLKAPRSPVRIMEVLSKNEKAKDFTIIVKRSGVKTGKINMNRLVLRARSGLFRSMFKTVKGKFNQVHDFSDLSFDALEVVMEFIQTGRLPSYFDPDPKKPDNGERTKRINILKELKEYDAAKYYQLTCPWNFYFVLDRR